MQDFSFEAENKSCHFFLFGGSLYKQSFLNVVALYTVYYGALGFITDQKYTQGCPHESKSKINQIKS